MSSRLMLSKSTPKIPISFAKNITLQKSSPKNILKKKKETFQAFSF